MRPTFDKAQRYSPSYKIADYSKIFYVLKDRNSIARNRQFYNLVKRVGVYMYGGYSVIKQKVFERDLSRVRYAWKFNYKTLNFPRKKLSNILKFNYKTSKYSENSIIKQSMVRKFNFKTPT